MLAAFAAAAEKAGVLHEIFMEKCPTYKVPDLLVDYARLRDLTIVPVPESYDQWYAEALIFGSGRPTLVLPESPRSRPFELGNRRGRLGFQPRRRPGGFRRASLARRRKEGPRRHSHQRKGLSTPRHSAEELAKNLARHGIDVVLDKVDANGRPIGEVLEAYVALATGPTSW